MFLMLLDTMTNDACQIQLLIKYDHLNVTSYKKITILYASFIEVYTSLVLHKS
jgi:hypothetical protein